MSRDGYREQIVTILSVETGVTQCDVGASLHSKTHSLFMYNIIVHYVYALMPTSIEACFYGVPSVSKVSMGLHL